MYCITLLLKRGLCVFIAAVLCAILNPENYFVLGKAGNCSTENSNMSCYLSDDFSSNLTIEHLNNEHPAVIRFNKTTFILLNECLCKTTSSRCSVQISLIFGVSYAYQAQNTTEVKNNDQKEKLTNKYECGIPNYSELSTKRESYIECARMTKTQVVCSNVYWSLRCALGTADLIWNQRELKSWEITPSDLNKNLLFKCSCNVNENSNCPSPTAAVENDSSQDKAGVIGGTLAAAVIVVILLLLVAFVIWRRKVKAKQSNGLVAHNIAPGGGLPKTDNSESGIGKSHSAKDLNFPTIRPDRECTLPHLGTFHRAVVPGTHTSESDPSKHYEIINDNFDKNENKSEIFNATAFNKETSSYVNTNNVTGVTQYKRASPNESLPPNKVTKNLQHALSDTANCPYIAQAGYSKLGYAINNAPDNYSTLQSLEDPKPREKESFSKANRSPLNKDQNPYSLAQAVDRPAEIIEGIRVKTPHEDPKDIEENESNSLYALQKVSAFTLQKDSTYSLQK